MPTSSHTQAVSRVTTRCRHEFLTHAGEFGTRRLRSADFLTHADDFPVRGGERVGEAGTMLERPDLGCSEVGGDPGGQTGGKLWPAGWLVALTECPAQRESEDERAHGLSLIHI